MSTIYVTDYLIARHEELLPIFERMGKTEYLAREKQRLDKLYEMRRAQNGNRPIQLQIDF